MEKDEQEAHGLIRQLIDHSVFQHMSHETSACTFWKKLEDMYQSKTTENKALLIRKFMNMKWNFNSRQTSEF